jgi:hypothetical protein
MKKMLDNLNLNHFYVGKRLYSSCKKAGKYGWLMVIKSNVTDGFHYQKNFDMKIPPF